MGCSACFVPVMRKTQNNRNFTLAVFIRLSAQRLRSTPPQTKKAPRRDKAKDPDIKEEAHQRRVILVSEMFEEH